MIISKKIQTFVPEMKQWRHHIHQNPEIAYEEKNTSDFIAKKLNEFGIEVHRGFGGTGIVGIIHGKDKRDNNKSIGIRADMDALPMTKKQIFHTPLGMKVKCTLVVMTVTQQCY